MKTIVICGLALTLPACAIAPWTGEGGFDGVPLDERDTLTCPDIPSQVAPAGASARDSLLRCVPQSQPVSGS